MVKEIITQLKFRGAPEWTKTNGQKKKDSRQEAQPDKIPLQKIKGAESGPPSYNSSHRPSLVNIESETDKFSRKKVFPP